MTPVDFGIAVIWSLTSFLRVYEILKYGWTYQNDRHVVGDFMLIGYCWFIYMLYKRR